MSVEPGGRGAKYGDEYENRYLARLLLRVVEEKISSVIVEPISEHSDSVEFTAISNDGITEHIQCKVSNGTNKSWTIASLQKYDVFTRAKKILVGDRNSRYLFISPLTFNELDELCKRARTTPSAKALQQFQLTNKPIQDTFDSCAKAFNLNINIDEDLELYVSLLSRCYFEQRPNGIEAVRDLEEVISLMFTGDAETVRVLLEQFANATGRYGKTITANDVVSFLSEKDIQLRSMNFDDRVLPRVQTINDIYWDRCPGINNQLLHRNATSIILESIKIGESVILHGKAGNGKSGCLQEVIDYLEQENILYLSVKLDRITPETSADNFGKQLGLPESPVHCLASLSGGEHCVLILDQLDALRWTKGYAATALSVCKELIRQTGAVKKHGRGHVSIIFACRTFDLETDAGLKNLFTSEGAIKWTKISVDTFSLQEVERIVGPEYNSFSSRLKKLLQTPSSLYVWSKLDENKRYNSVSSVHELMGEWWQQIQKSSEARGVSQDRLRVCKSLIVNRMEENSVPSLPKAAFFEYSDAVDIMTSCGIIISSGNRISFVHQSFLDYFVSAENIIKIYDGTRIVDLFLPRDTQIPQARYRLTVLLQILLEADQNFFVRQCRTIVDSCDVHYYYQCVVFEVISQCDNPNEDILHFIEEYSQKEQWSDFIFKVIICAHPVFAKHYAAKQDNWLDPHNLYLLSSLINSEPEFVVRTLSALDIKTEEDAHKVYRVLGYDYSNEADMVFGYRIGLLASYPELLNLTWSLSDVIDHKPLRAVQIIQLLIEKRTAGNNHLYLGKDGVIQQAVTNHFELFATKLYPFLSQVTCNFNETWPFYRGIGFADESGWTEDDIGEVKIQRQAVDLTKKALSEYAVRCPDGVCALLSQNTFPQSAIRREMTAATIANLPVSNSEYAIQWLLGDFDTNAFVITDNPYDSLSYTKRILEKHSSQCTLETFRRLETKIVEWRESSERMQENYKYRRQANKMQGHTPVYTAFWGHLQKELLPCLAQSRLLPATKELIRVLQRNTWVKTPYFQTGSRIESMKVVVSPVEKYSEKITNKRWLKIITTPNEKMGKHWRGKEEPSCFIEADHRAFSDSFGRQAKKEPERFANLALLLPADCYPGYILGVLYALEQSESDKNLVGIDLVCKVINKFMAIQHDEIQLVITRIITGRANEVWPDEMVHLIGRLATTHPHPRLNQYSVSSGSDPDHISVHTLEMNAINSVRGSALRTIAALMQYHPKLKDFYKPYIADACRDFHPAVRFATVPCLLEFYSADVAFATMQLKKLLDGEIRIVGANGFWYLMRLDLEANMQYYREKLVEACNSKIEDLQPIAASLLGALAIFCNDEDAFDIIASSDFSEEQLGQICIQALSSFNHVEYHDRSSIVILTIAGKATEPLFNLSQLFSDNVFSIQRDGEFFVTLMNTGQRQALLHPFLEYMRKTDEDICLFAEVLGAIGNSLGDHPAEDALWYHIDDLVQCTIRLLKNGADNSSIISIGLDILDALYKYCFQQIRPLSELINNCE